ncbi:DUF885 domain-containing protein [Flavobacterium stagni]|uniref:DUF885 domain-containing protein n=1 Tax=Flavobacterium stagni TaxID=2506421 RepID=A0A4Q1KCQ9_9FLAO|nr:DUF885 domain-containing protein [Flavobacterium stagni]RXR24685.1 DUF885 domain-containing protein [Flavobacterium stagni]
MKKIHFLAISIGLITLLIGCKSEKSSVDFTQITKDYFDGKNQLNPLEATVNGQSQFNDQLQFEMTDGYRKDQQIFFEKTEKSLHDVDYETLSPEEKISYDIIKWEVSVGQEMLQHPSNLIPLNQFSGTHLTMGQFAGAEGAQPFKTEKDYRNFLTRMDKFAVWMDSAQVYMKKGIAKNYVLPKTLTEKLIPQFEEMVTQPEKHLYYTAVTKFPSTFDQATRDKLTADYKKAIQEKLVPSFQRMVAFLKNEYLPKSRQTSGIGSLTGGKEWYASLAKQWTTTTKSPAEIHELGLKEVARIKAEMEKVKNQVGFKGSIIEFFDFVRNKKELMPFKSPEEVIANFEKIHATIKPNVDKLFALQPKTPFRIKRTEAFREKTASAEYVQGAADGSRPGTFYVPIPDVTHYNYYGDEDLFLHEAIPGHHFQISLQQENKDLPDFRKFNWFGAYGEGWALYTESLGTELGLYKDPFQYFGMLSNEMHRAIRLVVDTGMHTKGWTREQAIQFSLENEAESEASIVAEIERYMAIPGQALSYKIGQLKIRELRDKAQKELGKSFDIKMFHQIVLESGVMPLALLEQKVSDWIATSK